jgi:hypothetical protein
MGRVNTIKRGGSRFYVEPESGVAFPGVTSIIGMLPKPFLVYWAAKMTAESAVENIDAVAPLAKSDPDAAVDMLKGAHRRYTKSRSDLGSAAHDMFERMLRGERVRRVGMDLEPYRRHFAEFLDEVQPEMYSAEDVMWSDTHEYAGSSDAILRVEDVHSGPVLVMTDWKTSKDTYADVALQLSAYAHADRIIDPNGESRPMPEIAAGAVLHVTAERWAFKPVKIDDEVFDFFLALRKIFDWDREVSKTVIGKPIAAGGAWETGTERRAR